MIFEDKQESCAQGVKVTLKGDSVEKSCTTDFLGDFEFKGLPAGKAFKLTIEYNGYKSQIIDIKTDTDKNIGEVLLNRA